jgi:hypothetical protein
MNLTFPTAAPAAPQASMPMNCEHVFASAATSGSYVSLQGLEGYCSPAIVFYSDYLGQGACASLSTFFVGDQFGPWRREFVEPTNLEPSGIGFPLLPFEF